ncbi:MAG TPA: ABC transporter permease [Burkholderiales bacterium]|nr:ABC transporter permease [Burkholderiales bacterium]
MKKILANPAFWRGVASIAVFLILWEIGSRSKQWMAPEFFTPLKGFLGAMGFKKDYLPWVGAVPAPSAVLGSWAAVFVDASYWQSWTMSFFRVMSGFIAAMIIGIPFGLSLAMSRVARGIGFPVFEVLRPIPPLAWVPASIIFWPTQESAIAFITFLGAFYTIVINVLGGARSIDVRYFQAAQSMGASRTDIFRRVVLPGTLPSIVVGSAVGMGITWEVVVAAEMISGGGSQIGGTRGGGLGFFIWLSYVGGSYEQIVVGMISIGIAGFVSSELLRWLGRYATPWLKAR